MVLWRRITTLKSRLGFGSSPKRKSGRGVAYLWLYSPNQNQNLLKTSIKYGVRGIRRVVRHSRTQAQPLLQASRQPSFKGVDLLLTTAWPRAIDRGLSAGVVPEWLAGETVTAVELEVSSFCLCAVLC